MKRTTFGLPEKIIFCKKCVESNQRFLSTPAHKDFKLPVDEYPTGHLSTYPYPQR